MALDEQDGTETQGASGTLPGHADVVIVGAGFSGIAMAERLLRSADPDFVVLERAEDVGGTWRDNTYPGCACDVPSHLYSFSFAPKADWTETFSPQPEIQAYLRSVAEEHGVLPHVHFGTELTGAEWDDAAGLWRVETSRGAMTCRVLVAAPGPLSEPSLPELPGQDRFAGKVFHSARWDHSYDLAGKRVAVIGTGASSIQFVPEIQPEVAELHLFQRTAPWIMPKRARHLKGVEHAVYRRSPRAQRAMREAINWARELFAVPLLKVGLSGLTKLIAEAHLKKQVHDPVLRAKLTPGYRPGCKRILISNDYLRSLDEPNVEVVTDGVAEVRERSVVTRDGTEREVDTIIFGTGFQVTDFPIARKIRGRDGVTLRGAWADGMEAWGGTAASGFPNLFLVLGPNTGLGHTSVVLMAEAQADYIAQAIDAMAARGVQAVEVTPEAVKAWTDDVQRQMKGTVWLDGGCASWYLDEHGRNTTLWPNFAFRFRQRLRRFDPAMYRLRPATDGAHASAGAGAQVAA